MSSTLAIVLAGLVAAVAVAVEPVTVAAATPPAARTDTVSPWGELHRRAIVLAPKPEEWPIDETTPAATAWTFHGVGERELAAFLTDAGLAADEAASLAASARRSGDALALTPAVETRLALAPRTRARIYARLAQSPENQEQICAQRWSARDFAEWQAAAGLAPATLAALRALTYDEDGVVAFADLPALCSQIPDVTERRRLMCAIVRAPALVVTLRLHAHGGDDAAIRWWSAGDEDVERLLRAVEARHEDVDIDLAQLLPAMPRARLNRYPAADERCFDCGWTSLNFFAARPDPSFIQPDVLARVLRERYRPLASGEQLAYGDVVVLCLADGRAVHAAIYLADDLLYTKNGATTMRPWKITDLATLRLAYHAAPLTAALRRVADKP